MKLEGATSLRVAVSPNPQKPGLSGIKVIYVVERLNDVFGLNGWHIDNEIVETGFWMVVVRATLTILKYSIAIEQFGGKRQSRSWRRLQRRLHRCALQVRELLGNRHGRVQGAAR